MIARIAGGALAVLLLLWPAIYNGQPFFFSDTTAYVRGADAAIEKATGLTTPWTSPTSPDSASAREEGETSVDVVAAPRSVSSVHDKTVLSGRSIYYGALLYLGEVTGGFWFSVAIQAAMLTLAVGLSLRALGLRSGRQAAISIGVIALLTPAAFFASYLMPDMFAGISILACSALIALPQQTRASRLGWFVLLAAALCFHASHVLLAGGLLFLGGVLQFFTRVSGRWTSLGLIAAALVVAILAERMFGMAVQHFVGAPPIRPPFLMARVIDDGPGYRYLKATCPDNGFKVCAFVDRMPAASDEFLWSFDPTRGVFAASDGPTRRALSAEQLRFAAAVVAWDPLGQLTASTLGFLKQLRLMSLPEFVYDDLMRSGFENKVPAEHLERMRDTRAWHEAIPWNAFGLVGWITFLVALGFLIWRIAIRRDRMDVRLLTLIVLVMLGILLNAAICGVLSTPHDRYQARIAWLIPFCALLLAFSTSARKKLPAIA